MCTLCRAYGSEFGQNFHSSASPQQNAGSNYGDSARPAPAYANSVGTGATGNADADGLLSGVKWSGTVTYSFPDSSNDYPSGYGYGEHTAPGFAQISAAQQQAVHKIMGQLGSLTNLSIQYAGTNTADIQIAQSSEANPTAYAYYPNSFYSEGGDVWFGTSYNFTNPQLGDYYYLTHVHELGHAFGLKHGHEPDGVSSTALPGNHDALEYSVMTYRSYLGGPTTGYTNEAFGYPQSFMMNDILALQAMYGADYSFNASNTTYTWSATTGETFVNGIGQGRPGGASAGASANRVFLTIWDGGGNDTYDLSNYTSLVRIDLQPGSFTVTSNVQKAYLGSGHYAQGNVYNAYLFGGNANSYIENAIGGSGNDTLIGNAVANRLEGGLGNDTLTGGLGDDLYVYRNGGGADVITDFVAGSGTGDRIDLIGFSNVTNFAQAMAFAAQVGANTVFNFGGGSTLSLLNVSVSALSADDFTFAVPAGPNKAPTAITLSSDQVAENAAASVVGNIAVADPNGDSAFSFLVSDARFEVVGNPGAYRLRLKTGVSLDYETEPSVFLTVTATDAGGLSVAEEFTIDVIDMPGVTIQGTKSSDTIDATRAPAGQPRPTSDNDLIYGVAGNDVIRGLGGNDLLDGGSGNDTLYGGDGDDTLIGGAGADKLYGEAGDDIFMISGTDGVGDTFAGDGGTDRLVVTGAAGLTLAGFNAAAASIEIWQGNGGALLGNSAANIFNLGGLTGISGLSYVDGGSGNDTITGSRFADDLRGGAGNDTLHGDDGADTLTGGAGIDKMYGGAGNDTFVVSALDAQGDVFAGGDGVDRIRVIGSGDLTLAGFNAAVSSLEVWEGNGRAVVGTTKNDVLDFSGLTSVTGLSYVDGGKGNDMIAGSNFADELRGGVGNDTLQGGGSVDRLLGGAGKDMLTGGAGADTFAFAETGSKNVDTVLDYDFADGDKLDLSALLDAQFGPTSLLADFARLTVSGDDVLLQVDVNGKSGGAKFVDVAILSGFSTPGVDQVLAYFEQQAQVLSA